jgi:hypothetical protein
MPYYISPPPQNPLSRIITAIIAVFALLGTLMLGMAAFLVIATIGLVAGIAIWLRVIWIKRQLRKSGVDLGVAADISRESGHVIDAEYTVISDSEGEHEK